MRKFRMKFRQDKQIPTKEKPEDRKGRIDSQQKNKNWRFQWKWDGFWPSEDRWRNRVDSSIEEIQEKKNNDLVNIAGSVLFNGTAEIVDVRGKTLTTQEALCTDNTGSLRLVLWEQDTRKMKLANVTIYQMLPSKNSVAQTI